MIFLSLNLSPVAARCRMLLEFAMSLSIEITTSGSVDIPMISEVSINSLEVRDKSWIPSRLLAVEDMAASWIKMVFFGQQACQNHPSSGTIPTPGWALVF